MSSSISITILTHCFYEMRVIFIYPFVRSSYFRKHQFVNHEGNICFAVIENACQKNIVKHLPTVMDAWMS